MLFPSSSKHSLTVNRESNHRVYGKRETQVKKFSK